MSTDALDKACRISISADGLRATLQIDPGFDPQAVTAESVEAILAARGIEPSAVIAEAAAELSNQLTADAEATAEAVVAEGKASVEGVDGRFELSAELAPPEPKPPADGEEPAFDHYGRSAFIIVEQGQVVGTLHQHSEAEDGLDVRGEVIKATPGKPCQLEIDDTVELKDDGSVVSLRKGRVELSPTKLSVDPVLEIAESVDFSTGNVKFPGDVLIGKGVRDCFEVEVGGNLEIVELVEAAEVTAKGSVVLLRGMAGRGKGELSVGGDLEAKYLDGALVTVKYDLRVQREITNCTTHVGRCVRSPSCTVVGGELWARFGGEVRTLGGEAETETLIRLGVDAEMDACARMLEDLLPQTVGRIERARQELAEIQQGSGKPTPSQAREITRLEFEIVSEQARFPSIRAAIERVLAAYKKLEGATLAVEKAIMPGVTIAIGGQAATVREPIRGLVLISRDEQGTLVMRQSGTTTPMATKAKLHPAPGSADLDELRRWLESPALSGTAKAA
ncbi:MAG: FapA family protein [Phycisphaera sp.]|nr:MAG: FapA family protein [Phycisphaera sp.]